MGKVLFFATDSVARTEVERANPGSREKCPLDER